MPLSPSQAWLDTIRAEKRRRRPLDPIHLVKLRSQPFQGIARIVEIDQVLGMVSAKISAGMPRRFEQQVLRLTIKNFIMGGMRFEDLMALKVDEILQIRTYAGKHSSMCDFEISRERVT